MKQILLLTVLSTVLLAGCSTAFKAGQTPDDVYYSPGRERVAVKENTEEKEAYSNYVSSLDDRYLRMKVANRSHWSTIDDLDYWYDSRYDFGNTYTYAYHNYQYYSWDPRLNLKFGYLGNAGYYPGYNQWGWSSPVYTLVKYATPTYSNGTTPSNNNLSSYRNKQYQNGNYAYLDPKTGVVLPVNNNNNNSFGNLLKRVFTGNSETGNNSSYDRPARTFTNTQNTNTTTSPTPSTSSSAGGSSGGFGSTGSSTSTGRGGRGGN